MPSLYIPNKHLARKRRREKRLAREEERRARIPRRPRKPFSGRSGEIGERIADLRAALRLTQSKLSQATGTTQSVIARIEKGRHNLTIKKLEKIATALGRKLKIEII